MQCDPPCSTDPDSTDDVPEILVDHQCGYREMFETSPLGICRVDEGLAISFANRSLAALLGYASAQAMQEIDDVRCMFAEVRVRKELWAALDEANTVEGFECALWRGDSGIVWVSLSVRAVHSDAGELEGYNVFVADITERKNAEVLRDELSRLGRHDMKTPLNSILGLTSLLMDDDLSSEQHEILRLIEQSGEAMLDIINTSLAVYQLENGTAELRFSPTEPAALVQVLTEELSSHIQAKNSFIDLDVSSPGGGEIVFPCDRLLVMCMMRHMLTNALEATPSGQPVRVEINVDDRLRVTVRNQGVVPEEVRETFFEKYVTMGKKRGTGVGTYTVRLVAEAHGGSVGFSSSEEEGTSVWAELPLHGPEAVS